MFRRMIFSAVAATGALVAVAATPMSAEASPPTLFPHRFEDLVNRGNGWHVHGTYRFHFEGEVVAMRLRN